jgi:hypothetical protein
MLYIILFIELCPNVYNNLNYKQNNEHAYGIYIHKISHFMSSIIIFCPPRNYRHDNIPRFQFEPSGFINKLNNKI